jgi:hypothetical protein
MEDVNLKIKGNNNAGITIITISVRLSRNVSISSFLNIVKIMNVVVLKLV